MTPELNDLAARLGLRFFDYQIEVLEAERGRPADQQRLCLYYKTGAGKTPTALALVAQSGHSEALVLAPPSTHSAWQAWGLKVGVEVDAISHAKFREKAYQVSRKKPLIVDEFHLLGGHTAKGWCKLDRLAAGIQAPLLLLSATPNYNDADRVYCIQHVLDRHSCKGGFLEFLYKHCETQQNRYSTTPDVLGFVNFADAAEYLAALPQVYYLPDDLVYTIDDIDVKIDMPVPFDTYGYDERTHRIVASLMEDRHKRVFNKLVTLKDRLNPWIYDELATIVGNATTPVLVYANHATVANALGNSLHDNGVKMAVVTGATPAKKKEAYISAFRDGVLDILVGTASLATGTDGLDKMCDTLVILDDTDDDALRRQLIGRIMPRGADSDASKKSVYRFLLT